jgi:hypothetical protein
MDWSGVSNTLEIPWYLVNHVIRNRVFYMLAKHISGKNTMVFFNTTVLSQNFKSTLFPNTPSLATVKKQKHLPHFF